MAKAQYNADSITVLEGLEAVRKRPGMYIGGVGIKGLNHLIYEVLDNSVDEHLAGFCSQIWVTLEEDGSCTIKDNGRGIPVEMHKKGMSAERVVLSTLHAGGKFDNQAYKTSGGLHGVGSSVVNALSEHMDIKVYKNGFIHHDAYRRGIPTVELIDGLLPTMGRTKETGTEINFLAVLREDYDKLLRLLKKDRSLGSKKFYVHIPGDKGYRWPFIKIVNKNTVAYEEDHYKTEIWIDVFPMDFLANTKEERQKIYKKIVKYNYFAHLASYDWNFCRFICPKKLALQYVRWKLLHFIGAEFFVKRIGEGKFFGKQGKDYVGCVVYPIDPEKDKYSIEAFKKSIEVKFEDETFPIPSGFDEMLTNFYGDYMTPPPEKDRNGHKIRAYYISDRT